MRCLRQCTTRLKRTGAVFFGQYNDLGRMICSFMSTVSVSSEMMYRYLDGSEMSWEEKDAVRNELFNRRMPDVDTPTWHSHAMIIRQHDVGTLLNQFILRDIPHRVNGSLPLVGAGVPDVDAGKRMQLVHMETITIDDSSTTEIDDALSASYVNDDTIAVHVHIADPSRWISDPSHPLAEEAMKRTRTLYMTHGKEPMFPSYFGSDMCSLHENKETVALTMSCHVHRDGSIDSLDMVPSIVCSNKRLTYDDVDDMLRLSDGSDSSSLISLLSVAAEWRRGYRKRHGAISLDASLGEGHCLEILTDMNDDGTSSIRVDYIVPMNDAKSNSSLSENHTVAHGSNSRDIVAEMMILAGEISARLASNSSSSTTTTTTTVPLPYRGQEIPVLPSEEELNEQFPPGVCRNFHLRKFMLASITSASGPQPHKALGLPCYVQATSPIRRYLDLVTHWQLKALIRGETPVYNDADSLQTIIDQVQKTSKRLTRLERRAHDFWFAMYMAQQPPDTKYKATFLGWVQQEHALAAVYIDSLGKEVIATVNHPARVGDKLLNLTCTHADPSLPINPLSFSSSSSSTTILV